MRKVTSVSRAAGRRLACGRCGERGDGCAVGVIGPLVHKRSAETSPLLGLGEPTEARVFRFSSLKVQEVTRIELRQE